MKHLILVIGLCILPSQQLLALDTLISDVAAKANISEVQAKLATQAVFDSIAEEIAAGRAVSIQGFGKFYSRDMPPRTGRNPRTGQLLQIEGRRYPRFSASEKLKLRVRITQASAPVNAPPWPALEKDIREHIERLLP